MEFIKQDDFENARYILDSMILKLDINGETRTNLIKKNFEELVNLFFPQHIKKIIENIMDEKR